MSTSFPWPTRAILVALFTFVALPSSSQAAPGPPGLRISTQAALTSYDSSSWLGASIALEGRIAGAVWFRGAFGFDRRNSEAVTTSAERNAMPMQFGFRRIGRLPDGIELRGGGDFLLVLEEALPYGEQERVLAARPGGLLEIGMTLPLGARAAFELDVGLGAALRELPVEDVELPPLIGPTPRFQLRLGLRVDLLHPKALARP